MDNPLGLDTSLRSYSTGAGLALYRSVLLSSHTQTRVFATNYTTSTDLLSIFVLIRAIRGRLLPFQFDIADAHRIPYLDPCFF